MKTTLQIAVLTAAVASGMTLQAAKLPGPIFDQLGSYHYPVTTRSKSAQRFFDQGLVLLYAFNHTEAIRSFQAAAKIDPDCAMAYWGIACAYGPHVNKPMTKEDVAKAWDALQLALGARPGASPKEQAYIAALAKRYQAEYVEDRSALDKAYATAMRDVAKQHPDDLDAWTLLAEALMDTMPWDYWTKDRSPKPETDEALAALRYVMTRNPDHPGANHFYIHAVEAGPQPELALPAADRLLKFTRQAGHLIHMPSHIYVRVGQYHDATLANERAVKADQSYIRHCRAQGFYPGVYFPHNMYFLWFANVLEGRKADSLRAAHKVAEYAMDARCGTPVLEAPRFRHLPWLTATRFGDWDQVRNIPQPRSTNDFIMDRIMWHYTRGLGFAAEKQATNASQEHAEMVKLIAGNEARKLDNPQFPAAGVLLVARHLLAGKVAGAQGDHAQMIQHLKNAVTAEDALPYMEPPYWSVPTRLSLGAAYLQADDPAKAEQTFREELRLLPRNGWGLFGLEQSLRRQDKMEAAESVRHELETAWKYADVQLDLDWF